MAVKAAVLYPLGLLFGLAGSARTLFALSVAQAGEFGFFLLAFATQTRVLPAALAGEVLLVIALSMMLTPALFRLHAFLSARRGDGEGRPADAIDEQGAVIIAGMGRFGQVVNRMLTSLGHKTVVLDSRTETVDRMRRFGIKGFYGAVDRPDLLEAAGIAQARAIVLALDDPEKCLRMAEYVSRHHPQVKIIARARDRHHVYQLYAAGAPQSVREVFDSAIRAGKYALEALDYDADEIEDIAREFFDHDRRMLAELAEVWDPDIPVDRNEAYIARSREQTRMIEDALGGRSAPGARKAAE
jgi:CPA2 family monovalent cation:H+ antiporter-2